MTEVPHAGDSQQSSSDERLDRIIAASLEAELAERPPDRALLMRENPDLAGEINAFFADHDRIHKLADPLRAAHRPAAEPDTPQDIGSDPNAATLLSNASAGTSLSPLPAGTRLRYFGAYEILREIARGGMGVVYEARQSKLNRVVALKMILAGHLASPEDVRRFHAEAEAAASLDHPGIVPIFEVGEHEGQHFFSMGFVDGVSLASRIANGPLPPREAAQLVRTVAGAVQYAHTKGIIHRDLKPANVLLEKSGQPRVTDFGLARCVKADSHLTVSGQILGTPSYMPPEQARGDSADVTPLSDVYSLGAVLYCLVTGRPPFQAANPMDTLFQVMSREPVSPRQLNTAVPLDLETIILKCLEKQPSRRYASAQQLVEELTRFLEGRPILARPVSAAERGWRWCRRHPAIAALTAGIAASLVIGTIVSWSFAVQAENQARDARRSEASAVREKKRADAQAEQAVLNARRADEQSASRLLDHSLVICEFVDPRHGLLWLTRSLEEASRIQATELEQSIRRQLGAWSHDLHPLRAILRHRQPVLSVAFAPDGRTLVTASANPGVNIPHCEARRWDATTGQALGAPLKQQHRNVVTAAALTQDGSLLLTGSLDQTAQVWRVATGEPLGPPLLHQGTIVTVAISPNGNAVLTASDERGKTCLWKLGKGEAECVLLRQASYARSAAFSPDGRTLLTCDQSDNSAQLWDAETGQPIGEPLKHRSQVQSVAFSPDGKAALTACGKEVRLWNVDTQHPLGLPLVSSDTITSVVVSPDGTMLAIGDSTRVQLWDIEAHQPLGLPLRLVEGWSATGEEVACLAFSPDGRKLVAGGASDFARLWDLAPRSSLGVSLPHRDQIRAAVFSPDGHMAATGSNDKTARLWNVATGEPVGPPLEHEGIVWTLAFNADSKKVVTGSNDKTARLWDAATGQPIGPILQHPDLVMAVTFSPDGKTLLTASSDVQFWDVETGAVLGSPLKHPSRVRAMVLSPDGHTVATNMDFSMVQLWDVKTRAPLGLPLDHQRATPIGFTPDSATVFTAGADNKVRLWNARTGQDTGKSIEGAGGFPAGALRADGLVLLASQDAVALLLDAKTGKPVLPPLIHPGPVHTVAFPPNAQSLLTGCSDSRQTHQGVASAGQTRLWDGRTGKMLGAPQQHQSFFVEHVVVSPDGMTVLTGGADRVARLRRMPLPVHGSPERVALWAQVITGLELQDNGTVQALDAEAWAKRRTSLEQSAVP